MRSASRVLRRRHRCELPRGDCTGGGLLLDTHDDPPWIVTFSADELAAARSRCQRARCADWSFCLRAPLSRPVQRLCLPAAARQVDAPAPACCSAGSCWRGVRGRRRCIGCLRAARVAPPRAACWPPPRPLHHQHHPRGRRCAAACRSSQDRHAHAERMRTHASATCTLTLALLLAPG
jgi:hypothetical protein